MTGPFFDFQGPFRRAREVEASCAEAGERVIAYTVGLKNGHTIVVAQTHDGVLATVSRPHEGGRLRVVTPLTDGVAAGLWYLATYERAGQKAG